jgi:tagaturonate reductase
METSQKQSYYNKKTLSRGVNQFQYNNIFKKSTMQNIVLNKLSRETNHAKVLHNRVIQFGTGVLLRGLVDYSINNANSQNVFNGGVVQIKSTSSQTNDAFYEQDNLYTVAIRGMKNGKLYEQYELNSAISQTINANTHWQDVLQLAQDEHINIIVSNTTEAGIVLDVNDSITKTPPRSYPAKLLALLLERYTFFNGDIAKGYIIIPTELVSNNGEVLKGIVLDLAILMQCDTKFIDWISNANTFCNSLVDRIVTGTPSAEKLEEHFTTLGYEDELLIECEPYLLWAIEGNEQVKKQLSFALPNSGVVVETAIEKYKEFKLRILNGSHSFICGMAFLNGFKYVKDAMNDVEMANTIRGIVMNEIVPSLPYAETETIAFAEAVLERFANPFIDHEWRNITLNYTQKMAFRNIANIQRYYQKFNAVPMYMAKGFAYYIKFMQAIKKDENQKFYGIFNNEYYAINDPEAEVFYQLHQQHKGSALVEAVLGKTEWWKTNLNELPGFTAAVDKGYSEINA